ncbi:selenocysteine-specific translation elongation factor [Pantoea sp. 1.19]|uniref:selenocysteine-specific translation elongation factor n=1 Tax=Pantoea sp. 1.19 TaxID=1925589 RepID=UPI000948EE33|nr:selenocysteine-specific translation elongation factor [Pantoea sp. 1.19]
MIIVTAGHVDHGKTALLRAITGQDADRLPEEKRRGMTIDLGYAYWPQPDGRTIGFIDVPGHEKFLANMLSGTGGVDHALLVVACDDGIMAQTREHLQLLRLSGQPALSVALSKADRVSPARVNEVRQQLAVLLSTLGWQTPTFFSTDVQDAASIAALKQHLAALTPAPREAGRRFRLAVDRVFTVKGSGVVVTGTALSGEVRTGDSLWLTGCGNAVRVRGLHAQNHPVDTARGGQRVALNLAGDIDKTAIARGDWLLDSPPPEPVHRVLVSLTALQPLQSWQSVQIHHAARRLTGRVSPLADGLAELALDEPLWLADNDALILRDPGAKQTLAGCRVLQLFSPARGKRQPTFLHWLTMLAAQRDDDAAIVSLTLARGPQRLSTLGWARQLTPPQLDALLIPLAPLRAGDWLLGAPLAERWQQQILETLAQWHERHPDERGVGRARLCRMTLPAQPEALVLALIDSLLASQALINSRGLLHLPGFMVQFDAQEQALWQRVDGWLDDQAWWVRDVAQALAVEESVMRALLRKAARLGHLTAIVNDRYYRSARVQIFADLIRERDREGAATIAADFRDRLGIGRKLAVQILEFFDRSGFTRRRGNAHLLRDSGLFQA